MRVLYFSRSDTPHDRRFLTALAGTPHRVYWLRLEGGSDGEAAPDTPEGIELLGGLAGQEGDPRPGAWALLGGLREIIGRIQPDVVHAGPIQSCAFLAALAGARPLVSMSWGSDLLVEAEKDTLWRWATELTLRHSQVLIADCQTVRQKAEALGFPAGRTVVFPWGVDLERFSPGSGAEVRARYGWEKERVLLCLRTWEPIYGVDVVARAFVQAARADDRLRLILIGAGSQAAEIRRILEEGGVSDRVAFPGRLGLDELPGYYRAADLYLSASHSDGSSVSLLETLGCGVPALVSDIPSNREWVREGETGWLFPDGDAVALADQVNRVFTRPDCLAEVGTAARRLAERKADWRENFKGLLQAYELAQASSRA